DAGRRHGARLGRIVCGRGRADARRESANGYSNIAAAAPTQVITPRRTQLLRVPDLHAFRSAIAALAGTLNAEPRTAVVVVPTRSAARQLEKRVQKGYGPF